MQVLRMHFHIDICYLLSGSAFVFKIFNYSNSKAVNVNLQIKCNYCHCVQKLLKKAEVGQGELCESMKWRVLVIPTQLQWCTMQSYADYMKSDWPTCS